ncbi:MAG: mannosyltransferase family protein [Chloroflexota bacterium]
MSVEPLTAGATMVSDGDVTLGTRVHPRSPIESWASDARWWAPAREAPSLKSLAQPARWWLLVGLGGLATAALIYLAGYVLGIRLLAPIRGWGEGVPDDLWDRAGDVRAMFTRWDGSYYLVIAQSGYSDIGDERAYFPFYPLLVRGLSGLAHGDLPTVGALVSICAFAAGGLMLYKLARLRGDHRLGLVTAAAYFLFPMSFFNVSFYPEALFIFTSAAGSYLALRRRFFWSGLAFAIALSTRPLGWVFVPAFLFTVLLSRPWSRREIVEALAGLALVPVGMLSFLSYLALRQDSMRIVRTYTDVYWEGWTDYLTYPWAVFYDGLMAAVVGRGIPSDWFSHAVAWHDLTYVIGGLAAAALAWRMLPVGLAASLTLGMGFILMAHGPGGHALYSDPRRVAELFPIYLVLGELLLRVGPRVRIAYFTLSGLGLAFLAAWFASGRWVA